jgi:hypothetical protein
MNRKLKVDVKGSRAKTGGGTQRLVAFNERNSDRSVRKLASRLGPSGPEATRVEEIAGRERLVFSAEKELIFRCGSASITLLADGTVVLKGTRLVSSSTGLNRIRGASVKIN